VSNSPTVNPSWRAVLVEKNPDRIHRPPETVLVLVDPEGKYAYSTILPGSGCLVHVIAPDTTGFQKTLKAPGAEP
jgi:hypothetical protein